MDVAVGLAVAVVLVIGMAGVALFVASRRGHVRRESMQLAANISGPVGALLTGVALIFAAAELADVLGEENNECPLLLPGQEKYKFFDGCVKITGTRLDIDKNPPVNVPKRNDLYLDPHPRGIHAIKKAKIAQVDLGTPDREDCRTELDSLDKKHTKSLIDPKEGAEFCVKTRGNDEKRYAFGRVDKVWPQSYEVRIFVWKNP